MLFGQLLAERGFQSVIQSCRGTFGSGGTLDPFGPDEHDDGLATVAWLREQPWYPGSFGMCGPSYLGMVQWAIAADAGPDLKAIAVQVTSADFRAPFYPGGSFSLQTAFAWMCQVDSQEGRLASLRNRLSQRGRRPLLDHLPLRDLDRLATGHLVPHWQDWLAHGAPGDDFWKDRRFSGTLGEVTAPVSMVSGWHDIFLPLQLRDYAALRARRPGSVPAHRPVAARRSAVRSGLDRRIPALAARTPGRRPGCAAPRAGADLRHRRGRVAQPARLAAADPAAPLAPARRRCPGPGGPAGHGARPLHLRPGGPDAEPGRPGGPVRPGPGGQPRSRGAPDVLTYTSAPLAGDLTVMGEVTAELCVASSREHTDFFARLCDVDPRGSR